MLGKLIDGRLQIAGRIVKEGNTTITNPTEEMLKNLGYLPVVDTEKPEYNEEEQKLVKKYSVNKLEDDDVIFIEYEEVDLTDEEHNAIIQAEIVAEENKITARNIRNAIKGDKFALNKITEVEDNIAELRAKIREITNEE